MRQVPINYEVQGETRIVKIEKIVDGAVTPIRGKDKGERRDPQQRILDRARYHGGASADRSRFRAFGRNWNFAGRSAEICKLDWGNRK